jgi:hypothetical protein
MGKERSLAEKYYKSEDLSRFEEIGKDAADLACKFFDYYNTVFDEGELTERGPIWPGPPETGAPIALGDHCYACTAWDGFTCGGAIEKREGIRAGLVWHRGKRQ